MDALSLVSLDDLIKEIESRCICFIAAYELPKEEKKSMMVQYGKGEWFEAVGLGSILNNDILNNWNNELKTLRKINENE